jgi:hypothetical protein
MRKLPLLTLLALAMLGTAASGQEAVRRIVAPEASQGVAAGRHDVYAISNHEIGTYDKRTGERIDHWEGDPAHFKHMNSCALEGRELWCAASNYPDVPMQSMIEIFDAQRLRHKRTIPLEGFTGSLTVLNRHAGKWWAVFANYDGKGGEPGRDHRQTLLVELDAKLHETRRFIFPADILERFAPRSCSGAQWGVDGLLYVTGHDRPELYAIRVPKTGTLLEHVATYAIPTNGQAIDWDPATPGILWSIERGTREMVASPVGKDQQISLSGAASIP